MSPYRNDSASRRIVRIVAVLTLAACNSSSSTESRTPHATNPEGKPPSSGSGQAAPQQPTLTEAPMQQQYSELEEGVILLFEKVSIGNEPEANRRWKVTEDGTLWFSKNVPPVPPDQAFNQPYRTLRVLTVEERQALLDTARKAGFWDAPEQARNSATEDGMSLRLTIRDGERVKRVVADNVESPVIQAITDLLFKQP